MIVFANPVLYTLDSSLGLFHPDTIKYVTMARALSSDLALSISSFGHIDTGTILPPLYPICIALGSILTRNSLACAEYVSNFSLILAAIPLYFLSARSSSRPVAVATVCLLQFHGKYYEAALSPLTEALFVLIASVALALVARSCTVHDRPVTFLAGGFGALLFFARQVGILFLCFLVVVVAIQMIENRGARRPVRCLPPLLLLAGFLSLAVPYSVALYVQTGAGPFTQNFRRGVYKVHATAEDHHVMTGIKAAERNNYLSIYAQRRELRRLNADASEMYSFLIAEDQDTRNPIGGITRNLVNPVRVLENVLGNVRHLWRLLGTGLFVAFAFSMMFPVLRLRSTSLPCRVVWLWIVVYVCGLSLITNKLERYLVVLIPFAFVQMAIGLQMLLELIRIEGRRVTQGAGRVLVGATILGVCGAGMPIRFDHLERQAKISEEALPLGELRRVIPDGDPVFCLFPVEAYLLGGAFRLMPNDDIGRVAEYGRKTGVRWIVVRRDQRALGEAGHYTRAPWYRDPLLALRSGAWIAPRGSTEDGSMELYEILQ